MVYNSIIAEYPALAARSAARLDPDAALIDGALGLSGEIDELAQAAWANDSAAVLDEAGDVLWYLVVRWYPAFSWCNPANEAECWADTVGKIAKYEWGDSRPFHLVRNLIKHKLLLTERVKKTHSRVLKQGSPYPQIGWAACLTKDNGLLEDEVGFVLWGVYALLKEFGYTLEDACLANIAKLEARHPDGFNPGYTKEVSS